MPKIDSGDAKNMADKSNQEITSAFCCFSVRLKIAIFVVVEIQMLTFCKNR